jgi:pimeloyl-ACP methyl ester carboxylesterase
MLPRRYYSGLQRLLAQQGIASHAVDLQGNAKDMNRTEIELVADLKATLDELQLKNVVILGHSQGSLIAQCFLRDALSLRPAGQYPSPLL